MLGSLFGKAEFEPGLVLVLLPFEHEHTAQAGLHQEPVCSWAFLPSSAQQQQLYGGSFEPLHNIFDPNAPGQCQKCLFGGGSGGAALLLGLCWEQQLEEGGEGCQKHPSSASTQGL